MLACLGLPAVQDGTMLSLSDHVFAIDAPCGGINMLWLEGYVTMLLACYFRLDLKKTFSLSALALLLIVAGTY